MSKLFENTFSLVKFIFIKERLKLFIWIVGMSAFLVGLVPIFDDILNSTSDLTAIIEMMKNPAMISMIDPVYVKDGYDLGSMYANYMVVYAGILMSIFNIFLVSGNTRKDEEEGRLEILKSLPVGRLSNIMSIFTIVLISNLLIGTITALGMYFIVDKLSLLGCVIFSLAIILCGIFFAVLTMLFSQIFMSNRSVVALSFVALFGLYGLRAYGDLYNENLSLLSPLGLILRAESFVNNYYEPLLVILGVTLVLFIFVILFNSGRDLESGLIPQFKGKRHAGITLRGIKTFTLKMNFKAIILWSVVIILFSGMYGSVFGDLESYIESSDMMKTMFEANGRNNIVEQFISMLMYVMSIIACIPLLIFVHRIIGEEKDGKSDEILSRAVSRNDYLWSYLRISIICSVIFQILIAVGFWLVGKIYLNNIPELEVFLKSAGLFIPANIFMVSISVFLVGILPRATWLNYLYLAYSFFVMYLGKLLDIPEICKNLTIYGYVIKYPIEEIDILPSVVMIFVSIILLKIGFLGYKNRDIM